MIIVIIFGVLDVFSENRKVEKKNVTKKDYIFIFSLGIIGFFILKYKTNELGWLSWIISSVAGILIILLSILVLEEDDENI